MQSTSKIPNTRSLNLPMQLSSHGDHHGLHIPSLLLTQLQGRARELDVRLNSPEPAQQDPPLARLAAMGTSSHQHCNLIRDAILSLAQFGLHYRDADEPVITNTLQLLLHCRPDKKLLGQPNTHTIADTNSPFTIHKDVLEHTPYSHNQELHQWLKSTTTTYPNIVYSDIPPPPLLYEVDKIDDAIIQTSSTYHHDLTHYLAFAEWRTTRSQHPTMHPSHFLDAPASEWNIYSPNLSHPPNTHRSTPRNYITAFRDAIRLRPTSHTTTHPLTPSSLAFVDSAIMDILVAYNSPLVLTIDGSFKPSNTQYD